MYCIEKNAFNELSFIIIFSSSLISEHVQRYPGSLTYDGEGKRKMFLFENMFFLVNIYEESYFCFFCVKCHIGITIEKVRKDIQEMLINDHFTKL